MHRVVLQTELGSTELSQALAADGFQVTDEAEGNGLCISCEEAAVQKLAVSLGTFVFNHWLKLHIGQRVSAHHPYLNQDEQEYVTLLTDHALKSVTEKMGARTYTEWATFLVSVLRDVLKMSDILNLDGVIRFRIRDFITAVDEAIHEMVEHFLADREYEEFVSMLRFMLESQPASTTTLHVYCTDERVWICDESGALLRDKEVTAAAVKASSDEELNPEDLAMSILITRSPCKIVLHDLTVAAPWPSFPETLERVFLDRVTKCGGCSACKALQSETEGQQNKDTRSAMPDKYE